MKYRCVTLSSTLHDFMAISANIYLIFDAEKSKVSIEYHQALHDRYYSLVIFTNNISSMFMYIQQGIDQTHYKYYSSYLA